LSHSRSSTDSSTLLLCPLSITLVPQTGLPHPVNFLLSYVVRMLAFTDDVANVLAAHLLSSSLLPLAFVIALDLLGLALRVFCTGLL
jgi:hypothetical protein